MHGRSVKEEVGLKYGFANCVDEQNNNNVRILSDILQ